METRQEWNGIADYTEGRPLTDRSGRRLFSLVHFRLVHVLHTCTGRGTHTHSLTHTHTHTHTLTHTHTCARSLTGVREAGGDVPHGVGVEVLQCLLHPPKMHQGFCHVQLSQEAQAPRQPRDLQQLLAVGTGRDRVSQPQRDIGQAHQHRAPGGGGGGHSCHSLPFHC